MTVALDSGADVNAKNRRGSTPLHWAIHDEAKVRLLLARGAGVNTKQAEGRTPLYLAASLGNGHAHSPAPARQRRRSEPRTANGRTPLMAAAGRGDVEALRLLLDAKAAVNAKDSAGETALMLAATDGNPQAVRLLLEHGADARTRTKRNETALGNAGTSGNEDGRAPAARSRRGGECAQHPRLFAADAGRQLRHHSRRRGEAAAGERRGPDLQGRLRRNRSRPCGQARPYRRRTPARRRGADSRLPRHVARPRREARRYSIPDAVERALAMTEKQSYNFIRIGGCNSCHSQDLPSAAAAFARGRGLQAPARDPAVAASMMPSPERVMDLDFVGVASKAWELFDFGMNGVPKNAYTDAVVRVIKAMQTPEGHWPASESRRPPMSAGEFQTAALAIYAMKHTRRRRRSGYANSRRPGGRVAQARDAQHDAGPRVPPARPRLGRRDAGAPRPVRARRHAAGRRRLESAAGHGVGRLRHRAGAVCARHGRRDVHRGPVYQKGVDYLLRTQADDGTWRVKSRAIWLQPYFESGFPYGRDQFISTAGTAWAAMALAAAQPPPLAQR